MRVSVFRRQDSTCDSASFGAIRQRGISLIDVILAAAVILGTFAGVLVLFNNTQSVQDTNRTAEAITTMSSEIRGLYRAQGNFSDLTTSYDVGTEVVIDAGIPPEDLVNNTGAGDFIQTGFGSDTRIRVRQTPSSSNSFDFEVRNLPLEACTRLALDSEEETGPLGSDYTVDDSCENDNTLTATFTR